MNSAVLILQLDSMILKIFSNLNNSMNLWIVNIKESAISF